jgi:DtxR family Mn-dependent transcriptional regulator
MLTDRAEDYLEAAYNLLLKKGYVRLKDLSASLEVSGPSAIEMLRKLEALGLVRYEKYGGITLTDKGADIARVVKDRHDTLVRLLLLAGVPGELADKDACTLEHHLSAMSIEHLKAFVSRLEREVQVRVATL